MAYFDLDLSLLDKELKLNSELNNFIKHFKTKCLSVLRLNVLNGYPSIISVNNKATITVLVLLFLPH